MKYHITIENKSTRTKASKCMTFSRKADAEKYVEEFNATENHMVAYIEKTHTTRKFVLVILAGIIAMTATTAPAAAAVDGITADNYTSWEKTYPDSPGYNKGEADLEYLPGEEYFYNDYIDHWNVDRVYDPALIPADWNKAPAEKATPKAKAAKKAKKAKKSKKASKKAKKNKKSKKTKK